MSTKTLNRLLRWRFTLAFCALMAAMLVVVMPVLENFRSSILAFVLLPIGTVGACLIAYANPAKLD